MKKVFSIFALSLFFNLGLIAQNNASPLQKFNFRLRIDNLEFMFQEVSGLAIESKETESRPGKSPQLSVVKMPGLKKYGNVTLKKGIIQNSKKLSDFMTQIKKKTIVKTNGTVELINENGEIAMSWTLKNCWIMKLSDGISKNPDKEMAIESMEIANEGVLSNK